jgi:hypothetical protein
MKKIVADRSLIAACGLYCAACRNYLKGKCPGCKDNVKAGWCAVRRCCLENHYASCADCKKLSRGSRECKKFNNFMSKLFGLIFGSDRQACIMMIKQKKYEGYAEYMADNQLQSLKRSSNECGDL